MVLELDFLACSLLNSDDQRVYFLQHLSSWQSYLVYLYLTPGHPVLWFSPLAKVTLCSYSFEEEGKVVLDWMDWTKISVETVGVVAKVAC